MNGAHDVGGMHGFGKVEVEKDEPVFHEEWEGRAFAMRRMLEEKFPSPAPGLARHIIESIEPARYLQISYYERFLEVVEKRALAEGLVTAEEIEARVQALDQGAAPLSRSADPQEKVRVVNRLLTNQAQPEEIEGSPRFAEGNRVRALNLNWPGHNRLPRYIRGKQGQIWRVNGAYKIEDVEADKLGQNPQTVYTVEFAGEEVWGADCESDLKVYMELWEGYLEEA